MLYKSIYQKNKVLFKIKAVGLVTVLCFTLPAWGEQNRKVNVNQNRCDPIAKVISRGNRNWPYLKQLCSNDLISSAKLIEVFCYLNGTIVTISNGTVGEGCSVSADKLRGCNEKNPGDCFKIKGPDEDDLPTIITPYGVAILNPRPQISWKSSPIATSYIVQIEGQGVNWSVETKDTHLIYPQDQPALQPGNVYKLNVIAKQADEPKIADSSVFALVAQARAEKVRDIIKRLEELNMPQDELAVDISYVYQAENLLNEAIEVLKTRVKAGSQDAKIHRLLGDLYLNVDLPSFAYEAYTNALSLAKKQSDKDELLKAQDGIDTVDKNKELNPIAN
ncbi:MAG TPA: hypothetical protein V6D25_02210 [Leptolyngbyaceae cyanobacterium]